MIHIYWLGTQVSKWSPNSMKQKESKVLSASLLRLEAWAQHELQDTNHVTLSRILQRVVVPLASLVTNKPCTGSQEFRNIRLRLTIHLDTTCVHTQPLKPPSRGTPPNSQLWSWLKPSSPSSWPSPYSYWDRLSRHTGKCKMRNKKKKLQKTAQKIESYKEGTKTEE